MTEMTVVAAASLGVALWCLSGGRRTGVLAGWGLSGDGGNLPGSGRRAPGRVLSGRVTRSGLAGGLLAGLVCWLLLGQGWAGTLGGLVAVPTSMALLGWLAAEPERRRSRLLIAQLPGCLDLLAAALESGVPLRAAARHVAGLAPEPSAGLLRGVVGHLDIGRSDAQAWSTLRGHPAWGQMARDLARCADSGAAVAEVLNVHAGEARANRCAQRELVARTVGVRSVLPLVCCFLPAFVLVGVVPIIAATVGSFTQAR